MTILITGGAGFIGSALVAEATAHGHEVLVLDALTYAGHPQNLEGIEGNVTLMEGDICNAELLADIYANHAISAVIHAAAESHVDNSIAGSAAFISTNITGTHTLLEATRNHYSALDEAAQKHFRFLHISTDEVYGALGDTGSFTQQSPMLPNSPYAASKAASDHLVRAWGQTYGLPVLTTRCCNNYGPRQHPEKLIPLMITRALEGEALPVYGSGKQVREWIHVEDHARAVFTVLESAPLHSITHIGSDEEVQNIDVVTRICDVLAEKHGVQAHDNIAHVTDRLGHDFRYALNREENATLLPQTRDFVTGLADTIAWYLANQSWIATMLAHKRSWSAAE